MCDVKNKKCSYDGCIKQPCYNTPGSLSGKYCTKHKKPGMISIKHKKCKFELCDKHPAYNFPAKKHPLYCLDHKAEGMINIVSKRCAYDGCNKIPVFNHPSKKIALYCGDHKDDNMINVKDKYCEFSGCNILATFNKPGQTTFKFCSAHKEDNMINLKTKLCEFLGCDISARYNKVGEKNAKFCFTHKELDMINLKDKFIKNKCIFDSCLKRAYYNMPTETKCIYCNQHKQSGMIIIKSISHKKCIEKECINTPNYNKHGETTGLYCYKHKLDGMINIKIKLCLHDGCVKRVEYGKPGTKPSHCSTHREIGMIKRPSAKCKKCINPAIYGKNFTNLHCETHKDDDDINLVERECKSCHLITLLDKDDYCEYCNPSTFKTARLAKQNALMDYLDSQKLVGVSTDKIVNPACGKERPDRVFQTDEFILILECDENQHRDRPCSCEQTRMVNIGQAYGGMPVYFIRWNPDNYCPENNRKQCEDIKKRHKLAADMIKNIISKRIELPKALVSAIYLYYDGWNGIVNEEWKTISALE